MSEPAQPGAPGSALPFADRVNIVAADAPWRWLEAGWRDLRRGGIVSIGYGLMFVVAGLALTLGLYLAGFDYLIGPLVAGIMLVGPALTVGLYAISRDLENGLAPDFRRALMAWRSNPLPLLGLGLALVLLLIVWLRLAVLIFALSFPYRSPSLAVLTSGSLFTADGLTFLVVGTAVGGLMATAVFVTGAVSLPMVLDRRIDMVQAIVTSIVAVLMNLRTMAVWAAIVVVVTAIGFACLFVGLAVTLPLIGHATWHAYRALIRPGP